MRRIKSIFIKSICLCLAFVALLITTPTSKAFEDTESFSVTTDRDFRAVWVTPLVGDIPRYTSKTQYQNEILSVLETMEHFNFNILLFHVRIYNDALYESKYNNWSSYYSTNPDWEALPWIIEECHKRGIEFHAWMNPYRVATGSKSSNLSTIAKRFPASNPASRPENLIAGSGTIILNPGLPTVRTFLINTCMEVVEKYDVDAIHFDDYFYVEDIGDADASTYAMYNEGKSLSDWRRYQIDLFIEQLHNNITKFNEENNRSVQLGISPTPIYDDGDGEVTYDENGTAITTGSKTSYGGHYDDYHFVDSKKWIDNEWIDYFVPQCYHGVSSPSEFIPAIDWWSKVVKYKTVNLYIGIGLYRAGSNQDWLDEKEFYNEMTLIQEHEEIQGISIFSYKQFETAYKDKTSVYGKQMNNAIEYFQAKALPPVVRDTTNTVSGETDFKVFKTDEGNKLVIKKQEGIKWYAVYRTKDNFSYDNTDYVALTGNNVNGYVEYVDEGETDNYIYSVVPLTYSNVECEPLTATIQDDVCKVTFIAQDEIVKVEYLTKGESAIAPELDIPGFNYTWDKEYSNIQEDTTVNAVLSERPVIVTFLGPNGETVQQIEVKYNATIEKIKVEVEGYTFLSWDFDFKTPITEDISIVGKYRIENYKVWFYVNGELIETIKADYNTPVTPPEINVPEGYVFKGWDRDLSAIKQDMAVKAILLPAIINIKFVVDNDTYHELAWDVTKELTLPADPTKEGYTFKGWDKDLTGIIADATVRALFEANEYQVTFYDNGTLLGSEYVKYGEKAKGFEPLGKENHTFIGWSESIEEIKGDLTVQAVYELNSYKLTIKDKKGNTLRESTISYGTKLTQELVNEILEKEVKNFTVISGNAESVDSDVEITVTLASAGCNNATVIYFTFITVLCMAVSLIRRKGFK